MTTSANQREMLRMLADSLRSTAIDLSSEGSAEFAFPIGRAREVFDALESAGVLALGGDLWIASEDGYASAHDGWYASSDSTPAGRRREWERFLVGLSEDGCYYVTFVV